ncbi:MAG TPA: hypothetical protein VNW54_07010 [Granulicella sp.]|jgi:hypothetical protein|nr:hypothetical protein [Granulicella sp.]
MTEAPYFHTRLNQRHSGFRHTPATRGYLVPGQLETRRATALLYGLQIASSNAALNFSPYAPDVVRTAESTPDGLDLADPGATRNLASPHLKMVHDEDPDDEEDEDDDEEKDDAREEEEE